MEAFEINPKYFEDWKAHQEPKMLESLGKSGWGWEQVYNKPHLEIKGSYFTITGDRVIHTKPDPPLPATINAWIENPRGESLSDVIRRLIVFRTIRDKEL
jgi:hypothetical protein